MRKVFSVLVGLASVFSSVAALAHHSFSAEFDVGRPVDITGTVTEIEWTNPHAWIHMDVVGEEGEIQSWEIELLGINALVRNGMTPETAKPGEVFTVTGFGSRDGTNTANASSVTKTETGESLWSSNRK